MKIIFKYIKKYKISTILAPLFKLLEALIDLFIPFIVARIIDIGIGQNNNNEIIKLFIVMILAAFLGLGFSLLGQYFSAKTAVYISSDIREDIFKKLTDLPIAHIDNIGTSTMIARITSDVNNIQTGINLTLRLLLRSPFVVFGAAIFATIISKNVAYVFWTIIVVLAVIVFVILFLSMPMYKKQQGNLDKIVTMTRDNLNGLRVIRAFTRENEEIELFNESISEYNKSQNKSAIISTLMSPLTYVIVNLGIIILVLSGAKLVENNTLLTGDVVALYNYMSQILVELIKLANLIITISKALASASRIKMIFEIDTTEKIVNVNQIIDSYIEFKNVNFKYPNSTEYALENINFKLNRGDIIGIIGGTGSGKTTILNLLLKYYVPDEGSIYFEGKPTIALKQQEILSKIGIALQKPILFKGTIRENLLYGNKIISDNEILKICEIAQCLDIINSKEDGLNSIVEQNGRNFSGGQKQRLCIARALLRNPEVLILDDSTSALDYLTDANFRNALSSLQYRPTILIVSQRTSSILHADNILVLDDGKQLAFDKHANLVKDCELYREIYYSQFEKEDNI